MFFMSIKGEVLMRSLKIFVGSVMFVFVVSLCISAVASAQGNSGNGGGGGGSLAGGSPALQGDLDAETVARIAADAAEAAAREAADLAEADARAQADVAEANDRTVADALLQSGLDAEEAARIAAII